MTFCPSEQTDASLTFNGLMLFEVSREHGVRLRHQISHGQYAAGKPVTDACSQPWTGADSDVKRSLIVENYVLSISSPEIRIMNIKDPTRKLPTLARR